MEDGSGFGDNPEKGIYGPTQKEADEVNSLPHKVAKKPNFLARVFPFVFGAAAVATGAAALQPQEVSAQEITEQINSSTTADLVTVESDENYKYLKKVDLGDLESLKEGIAVDNVGQMFQFILPEEYKGAGIKVEPVDFIIQTDGTNYPTREMETPEQKAEREKSIFVTKNGVWKAGEHKIVVINPKDPNKQIAVTFVVTPRTGV